MFACVGWKRFPQRHKYGYYVTGGVLPGWTTNVTCMSYEAFNMVIINLFVLVRVTCVNVFNRCTVMSQKTNLCHIFHCINARYTSEALFLVCVFIINLCYVRI